MSDKKVIENLARIVNDLGSKLKERPEVVRCKDCCMGEPYPRETGKTWCHLMSEPHKDDWYCADGFRKDGECNG